MSARFTAFASALLLVTTAAASAAPPFPPVPDDFQGTQFRGLALGQTREQVEMALAAVGKRCYTAREVQAGGTQPIEQFDGYTTCRITDEGEPPELFVLEVNALLNTDLAFGMPVYAVSFFDGRAAAISLTPGFFNSAGTTPYAFAKALIDNYPIVGFEPTGTGWRGVTDKSELIQVWQGSRLVPMWVTVFLATDANTRKFD